MATNPQDEVVQAKRSKGLLNSRELILSVLNRGSRTRRDHPRRGQERRALRAQRDTKAQPAKGVRHGGQQRQPSSGRRRGSTGPWPKGRTREAPVPLWTTAGSEWRSERKAFRRTKSVKRSWVKIYQMAAVRKQAQDMHHRDADFTHFKGLCVF